MNRVQFAGRSCNIGVTLIEILISLVILIVGLLGLAGLQGKLLKAEMEAQQRNQAQMLAQGMIDRIRATATLAAECFDFVNGTVPIAFGTGYTGTIANCVRSGVTTSQDNAIINDVQEWSSLLEGSSATDSTVKMGTMINARGCIERLYSETGRVYRVSVVWQGLNKTEPPPNGLNCGKDLYGDEAQRRIFVLTIRNDDS